MTQTHLFIEERFCYTLANQLGIRIVRSASAPPPFVCMHFTTGFKPGQAVWVRDPLPPRDWNYVPHEIIHAVWRDTDLYSAEDEWCEGLISYERLWTRHLLALDSVLLQPLLDYSEEGRPSGIEEHYPPWIDAVRARSLPMPETKPSPAFQVGACGVTRSGTVWTAVELRPHLNGDPAYVVAESAKGVRRVFYAFEWFGLRVA